MTTLAYYNENDPKAAAWLGELIREGHIALGIVDTRSIEDVTPADLEGFTQCHFFAGIGGWSLALRLAGWPDNEPVWTGSCPCQPFSTSGKGRGFADERHLWPAWHWLIAQSRPSIVFGEQVAKTNGREWFELVRSDLELCDFAMGGAVVTAAGIGTHHIRERLYWMADAGSQPWRLRLQPRRDSSQIERGSQTCELENAARYRRSKSRRNVESDPSADVQGPTDIARDASSSFWSPVSWVDCLDGKRRPIEPGSCPVAYGVSGRVDILRGYGNAIVPQNGAAFVEACVAANW